MAQNTTVQLYKRLLFAILLSLLLLAVSFFWLATQAFGNIASAGIRAGQPAYADEALNGPFLVTCTLGITTSDTLPPHQSFTAALPLTSYQNLALVSGTQFSQVQAHDDYFVANPKPGTFYQVKAHPAGIGNYNLGMVVYDVSYQPIVTDFNALDGYQANVRWMAGTATPYYVVVSQISDACSGGYYNLAVQEFGYLTYLPVLAKN